MKLAKLTALLDETLEVARFADDPSNNGLQLEATGDVHRIVFGVDGCMALFDEALERDADLVVVHHGLSWRAEPRRFTGVVGARLKMLFENGISLYAAHLPLDAHPKLGNNAQLADMIQLKERRNFFRYAGIPIGFLGNLDRALSVASMAAIFEDKLDTRGKIFGDRERLVRRCAVVSGGAGMDALVEAAQCGADVLIIGEFSHEMYHLSQELEFPVISLGHYASETVGVKALSQFVAERTLLECEFVDIPTGL